MRPIRLSLILAGLVALCACGGIHTFSAGVDPGGSSAAGGQGVAAVAVAKEALPTKVAKVAAASTDASHSDKLIALTFDDGPRPYVLFGSKGEHRAPGLVDILDQNGVKATQIVCGPGAGETGRYLAGELKRRNSFELETTGAATSAN